MNRYFRVLFFNRYLVFDNIINFYTNNSCEGHQGNERTFNIIPTESCYQPYMYKDIKTNSQKCERCAISKILPLTVHTSMGHISASQPKECIAIDFSVLEKSQGFENVLVLTDVFSKWTIAVPTRDKTAQTVAKVLQ